MINSQNDIRVSGREDLTQNTLIELVPLLSPDEEFFSQEESNLRDKIYNTSAKKTEIKHKLEGLEEVEDPGIKPDFDKVTEFAKDLFGGWFGLVMLMFFIHCIMWIVRLFSSNSWDTWQWTINIFIYGFIICCVLVVGAIIWYYKSLSNWETQKEAYNEYNRTIKRFQNSIDEEERKIENFKAELQKINTNREKILVQAYRLNGLPLKSLTDWEYLDAKKTYFAFLKLMHDAYLNKNINEIIDFINTKYEIFYNHSLASESPSNEILRSFRSSIPLRVAGKINREAITPNEVTATSINFLFSRLRNFTANEMDRFIDDCNQILEMDTSGFFTKHDLSLLEIQINNLQSVYHQCARFVDGFQKLAISLNEALGICRLVAFRNIYLGAELLNVTHRGAGGGKSTTSTDSIGNIEFGNLNNIEISSFSVNDSINAMVSQGLESMSTFISSALSQKDSRKYVVNNPKSAALAAAGAAAFGAINAGIDAWKKRNAKVNDLINKQEQIFSAIEQLIANYESNYPLAVRSFELIEAISKVNTGFITIYQPIFEKIFIHQDVKSVSMEELHTLRKVLSDYNKIAKTEL